MRLQSSGYMLILLVISVVVVSGCTESTTTPEQDTAQEPPQQTGEASFDTESTDSTSENQETSTGTTEDTEPAEISLSSFDVPEEVEMGESFNIEATFENTGGESGEFETTVMMREMDSETFSTVDMTIGGEIPAGEEKTYEKSMTANSVSTNVISLAGTDAESNLRIVPKRIQVGEEYTTSNGIGITVESIDLEEFYMYEDYMGEESVNEPESGQYVFVDLRTQNQGNVPKSLPSSIDFQVLANNRQYESTILYDEPADRGESYEGGEVQPGIIRDGYMAFEVPEDVNKEDISVVWNEMISLEDKSVYWTT